jgi:hypothetical protein
MFPANSADFSAISAVKGFKDFNRQVRRGLAESAEKICPKNQILFPREMGKEAQECWK